MMARSRPREDTRWGAVAAATAATFAAATPAFTAGALSGRITSELGIGAASFGFALALFFAATALGSPISARIAERLGAAVQFATATVLAGTIMARLGTVSSLIALAALLAAGGLANSLVGPAAGLVLGSVVSDRRLFLASGLVQAALAAPPLSAGLLMRFLAEPYGWRAAFSAGGVLVVLSATASVLARKQGQIRKGSGPQGSTAYSGEIVPIPEKMNAGAKIVLLLWALGAALGTIGVTATASFFVPIASASGFPVATAGLLVLAAGALAALVRIGAGMLADLRPRSNLAAVVGMMLAGGAGLLVMVVGNSGTFLVGIVVVVAGLWGWNGLLVASAVRLLPGGPARSLGVLQVGFFSGATAAPLVFGILSGVVGIGGALVAVAASAVAGAGAVAAGEFYRRSLQKEKKEVLYDSAW